MDKVAPWHHGRPLEELHWESAKTHDIIAPNGPRVFGGGSGTLVTRGKKTNWPTVRILNDRSTKITKISLLGASDLGIESGNGNGPKVADSRFLIPRRAM